MFSRFCHLLSDITLDCLNSTKGKGKGKGKGKSSASTWTNFWACFVLKTSQNALKHMILSFNTKADVISDQFMMPWFQKNSLHTVDFRTYVGGSRVPNQKVTFWVLNQVVAIVKRHRCQWRLRNQNHQNPQIPQNPQNPQNGQSPNSHAFGHARNMVNMLQFRHLEITFISVLSSSVHLLEIS